MTDHTVPKAQIISLFQTFKAGLGISGSSFTVRHKGDLDFLLPTKFDLLI